MLKGVGASSGIGIGTIVCIREESLELFPKVVISGRSGRKGTLKRSSRYLFAK